MADEDSRGDPSSGGDAWFAGHSGSVVTVVWVGLDDGESLGLTGAAAAEDAACQCATVSLPSSWCRLKADGGLGLPDGRGLPRRFL
jgi:hypothetical protein